MIYFISTYTYSKSYMRKKINYSKIFVEKVVPFLLSIFIVIFSYISYWINSESNFIRTVGDVVDDTLLYKRIYPENNHQNEVVIIKVDKKTLDTLQKSDLRILSFSKTTYATVIEKLIEEYKVAAIWVDIIFANKSYYGEKDELQLQDTLEKYKDKVVIASRWDNRDKPLCIYNNVQHGAIEVHAESRIRKFEIDYDDYDVHLGCSDSDTYEWNISTIQAFWIEVYKKYLGSVSNKLKWKKDILTLERNLSFQKQENNWFLNIGYSTNKENNTGTFGFRSYSLADIIDEKEIDLSWKIVLIGEVWTVLHDTHFTPINFKYKMPGVEIHANIVTSLLYESYLKNLGMIWVICIALLSSLLVLLSILNTRTLVNLLLVTLFLLIHIIVWLQFFISGTIYPIFFMIYTIILSFIGVYMYKFIIADKNRRFFKKAFSMYLSPEMVDVIYKDPSKLNLRWEKWEITVFFSDIASFTSISENMKAEILFDFLNNYFNEMTKILLKNRGTLDKYIGDAVMWFFNAPLEVENHEYLACKTALQQIQKLKILNKIHAEKWLPEIDIRIGISTWEVMHGNLGASGKRISYSVIGDDVNLASRLEWVNKAYGTKITISERTYKKIHTEFTFREIDTIQVKWKTKWVKIYELLWLKGTKKAYWKMIENYEEWLHSYYNGKYKEAITCFEKNKKDIASQKMIERCKWIEEGKISVKDGVYKFTTK